MKKVLTIASIIGSSVSFAMAQGINPVVAGGSTTNASGLLGLLSSAQSIVNNLVPFAIGIAVLAFFWYLIKFIMQGGASAEAKAASTKGMGYAILALFLMVAVWGIIAMLSNIFGIGLGGGVPVPGLPQPAN